MSKYIEQERIGKIISNLPTEVFQIENRIELVLSAIEAINAIKEAPSIDIVRCGECKHWHKKDGLMYCDRIDYGYGYKADDFCSYGKIR